MFNSIFMQICIAYICTHRYKQQINIGFVYFSYIGIYDPLYKLYIIIHISFVNNPYLYKWYI